jgi:hypothetical protein
VIFTWQDESQFSAAQDPLEPPYYLLQLRDSGGGFLGGVVNVNFSATVTPQTPGFERDIQLDAEAYFGGNHIVVGNAGAVITLANGQKTVFSWPGFGNTTLAARFSFQIQLPTNVKTLSTTIGWGSTVWSHPQGQFSGSGSDSQISQLGLSFTLTASASSKSAPARFAAPMSLSTVGVYNGAISALGWLPEATVSQGDFSLPKGDKARYVQWTIFRN